MSRVADKWLRAHERLETRLREEEATMSRSTIAYLWYASLVLAWIGGFLAGWIIT